MSNNESIKAIMHQSPGATMLEAKPPGAAGLAIVEMGSAVLAGFDADTLELSKLLVRRPIEPPTIVEAELVIEDVDIFSQPEGTQVEVQLAPDHELVGRLALLNWLRRNFPIDTDDTWWALESAALNYELNTPETRKRGDNEIQIIKHRIAQWPGRLLGLTGLGRILDSAAPSLDAIQSAITRTRFAAAPQAYESASQRSTDSSFPVMWDRVPHNTVDATEHAVRIRGNQVLVEATRSAGAPKLHAVVTDEEGNLHSRTGMDRIANFFTAELKSEVQDDQFLLVTGWPDEPLPTIAERERGRMRREAFRALHLERLSTGPGDTRLNKAVVSHWFGSAEAANAVLQMESVDTQMRRRAVDAIARWAGSRVEVGDSRTEIASDITNLAWQELNSRVVINRQEPFIAEMMIDPAEISEHLR